MRIYFSHSRYFDFKTIIYEPIRQSALSQQHEIIFPHETSDEPFNSKDLLPQCDAFLAEVSFPSTGLGIELGWADTMSLPIICFYQKEKTISPSCHKVTDRFIEYEDSADLIQKIQQSLEKITG